ncbi:MAG: HAD-IB family phosphatase [Blastocatellia bacterium]
MTRKPIHVFSDFDGTITSHDTLIFLTTRLGGGAAMIDAMSRLLREGELSLRDCIAGEMRSIRAPFAEAVELLRAEVKVDPGFAPMAAWLAAEQIPLTVLSAGFHQLIEQFLDPHDFPGMNILANQLHPDQQRGWQCEFRDQTEYGHDKTVAVRQAKAGGFHTIFIGDGFSDRAPAAVADELYAKHRLADYCRAEKIPFQPYDSFADVLRDLRDRHDRTEGAAS